MIKTLIVSLVLTLAVELAGAFFLDIRDKKGLATVALANIITNPAVVFISALTWQFGGPNVYAVVVSVLEIMAIVIEMLIYKKNLCHDHLGMAIKISLLLNFCSYFAGEIINML